MPEKNIVIAGGGFAGISALRRLNKHRRFFRRDFNIVLADRKPFFEFLPMLPDVIGGWMPPGLLRYDLSSFARKEKIDFINAEVKSIDTGRNRVKIGESELDYEYMILATGSETNFYGKEELKRSCLKLDEVKDAILIKDAILKKAKSTMPLNILVIGGGYTGIEIATNINFLLRKMDTEYHISILEKSDDILLTIPVWMRTEVKRQLEKLNIKVLCGDGLKVYDGDSAVLGSGKTISNALCVWAAGVKTSDLIEGIRLPSRGTRIKVDKYLRPWNPLAKNIFIAGDNAFFESKVPEKSLRMAVMFSMGQGKRAADNIVNSIRKKTFKGYHPLDLGYIVPMAHGKAPGSVVGLKVRGLLGYIVHYFMCAYRSEWRNKPGILKKVMLKIVRR